MAKENDITSVVKFGQKFIAGESTKVVNASDLHDWLSVKSRFNDWIDRKISEYDFENNQDYLLVEDRSRGRGRPKNAYWLTVDMAKELSMLEKTEKGKEARKYFLECERIAKEVARKQMALPISSVRSIKKAQLVLAWSDGQVEVQEFTEKTVNSTCRHVMPKCVLMNYDRVHDALAPIQQGMAAGLSLWSDLGNKVGVQS